MEIPVLIEPVEGGGYRAATLSAVAEGTTKEESLANLKAALVRLLHADPEFVSIKLPPIGPWAKSFRTRGSDDPELEEWQRHVEEFRRQMNEELDRQ